jgi:hypothetical protein
MRISKPPFWTSKVIMTASLMPRITAPAITILTRRMETVMVQEMPVMDPPLAPQLSIVMTTATGNPIKMTTASMSGILPRETTILMVLAMPVMTIQIKIETELETPGRTKTVALPCICPW